MNANAGYRWVVHAVAVFAAVFTLPLLYVGGSVTTYRVGMAVPDWPTTFHENMFLYDFWNAPFGVRVEHSHRLYGAAVGLATIVLAGWFLAFEPRRWLKGLGVLALAAVVGQGVLGGMRVDWNSTMLAAVHGCTGQAFFGLLVALCVFTGRDWSEGPGPSTRSGGLRLSSAIALGLVYTQIVRGRLAAALPDSIGALVCIRRSRRRSAVYSAWLAWRIGTPASGGAPAGGAVAAARRGVGRPDPPGASRPGPALAAGRHRSPGAFAPGRHPDRSSDQCGDPVRRVDRADIAYFSPSRRGDGRRRAPARRETGGTAGAGRAGLGGRRLKSLASLDQPLLAVSESGAVLPAIGGRVAAYLSLTKPRLVLMVLVTVAVGYLLGARGGAHPTTLAITLLGTAMVAGGAGALNQWLERDRDALMRRTANRALPGGRLSERRGRLVRHRPRRPGHALAGPRRQSPGGLGRPGDVPALRLRLHAAEDR